MSSGDNSLDRLDSVNRRRFMALVGAASGVTLAGCSGGNNATNTEGDGTSGQTEAPNDAEESGTTEGSASTGGTLNVQLGGPLDNLDPHVAGLRNVFTAINRVYHKLFEPDQTLSYVPVLADGFQLTDDGNSAIIPLKEGVMFHPPYEREMVAEDVVSNFDRVNDPDTGSPRTSFFDNWEDWYAEGDYELRIDLAQPEPTVPVKLGQVGMQIISPEAIEDLGDDIRNTPVGTGPFKFEEWSTRDFIHFSAYENYFQTDLPHIDDIYFRPIEEPATAVTELETGSIQFLHAPPTDSIPNFQESSNIEVPTIQSPETRRRFHINASDWTGEGRDNGAPTQSQNIRQAIYEALDANAFLEIVENGYGETGQTVYPENSTWGIDYSPHSTAANPERARELIAESDFDTPVPLSMIGSSDLDIMRDMVRIAQDQLNQAGFEVNLQEMETAAWVERLNAFRWDLTPNWGGHSPDPALQRAERTFWTNERDVETHVPYYDTPDSNWERVFEIFEEDDGTLSSEERYELYAEQQRLICDDCVYAVLYHPLNMRAHRTSVQNYEIPATAVDDPFHRVRLTEN